MTPPTPANLLALALAAALAFPLPASGATPAAVAAPSEQAQRIDALEARVRALESQLSAVLQAQGRSAAASAPAAPTADTAQSAGPTPPVDDAAARADALLADDAPADTTPPTAQPASSTPVPDDTAATAEAVATTSVEATDAGASAQGANGNAFNPAISIVLNGSYSGHTLDPDAYWRSGFPLVGEGVPSARGFSLGESEISFAANIDDKFFGQLTVAMGGEDGGTEVGVEEAFVETTALPNNLSVRAGRFFSNVGYLNSHHAHTDKFFDRPLPYQAFLGNQYGDDGVQLRWVAPTDVFLELGGELFRGENFPAGGAANGGNGVRTLFAHVGGDISDESSWLAGLSAIDARADGAEDGFSGDTRLLIADATWKWAPGGNVKDGGVTLRGEYFQEDRDGAWIDPEDATRVLPWNGKRDGAYAEAVWRINRRWEAGYRYDWLSGLDAGPFGDDFDPVRHTVALTWLNSEFSLLRLQLSHDRPNGDDSDDAFTLQYQFNLGAHGAHKF
jgi:hypothetical protein